MNSATSSTPIDLEYSPLTEHFVIVPREMTVTMIERKNTLLRECLSALVAAADYDFRELIAKVRKEITPCN